MALEKTRIEIIHIGDELLAGRRENLHLKTLGRALAAQGLNVTSATVVGDEPAALEAALKASLSRAALVITTGGLGPTADDTSRAAAASALGKPLVTDAAALEAITAACKTQGREPSQAEAAMAQVPEGSTALPNSVGYAAGIWHTQEGEGDEHTTLVMLPGPVHELSAMLNQHVLPKLSELKLSGGEDSSGILLRCFGMPEREIEALTQKVLEDATHAAANITAGYYPNGGCVDIHLKTPYTHTNGLKALQSAADACCNAYGDNYYGIEDTNLAEVVAGHLRALEGTVAFAESCTGGLLSSLFTDVPGASDVYQGGIVCYSNESKISQVGVPEAMLAQHGAVSEEVAAALATGITERLDTQYGLSVTGYAGPEGGKDNPVGTVFIGYSSPTGMWSHHLKLRGTRAQIKQRAAFAALDFMRRKLEQYKLQEFMISETNAPFKTAKR